jgi:hypothetical protein
MNTKEAIEFLEDIEYKGRNKDTFDLITKIQSIIDLLQQGEKYRQMWEELKKEFGEEPIELHNLNEFMEDLEQKYFPKEASQDLYDEFWERR